MRKLLLLLALLTVFTVALPVQAQDDVKLSSVSINIWPEYDQSAVLVIYHITLAPDTPLPATLNLHVPVNALVNAVAVLDPVSGLVNATYERSVEDEWALLTITVTALQVQVEYYDALMKTGTTRNVVFEWAGDYALGTIEINFLEPLDARNVRITPPPVESAANADGLMNHIIWTSDLSVGQSYIVAITYDRDSDAVTNVNQPVEAVSPPGDDTPGHTSLVNIMPWLLAGLGVLLLVASVTGLVVWQKGDREVSARKRHKQRPVRIEEVVYCPRCGKRAQPGDGFCRTCGARLNADDQA